MLVIATNMLLVLWMYGTEVLPSELPALFFAYAALLGYYAAGRACLRRRGGPNELHARSWLLGLAASLVMSVPSLRAFLHLLHAPNARFLEAVTSNDVFPEGRPLLLLFSAEMMLDMVVGSLDYPAQLHPITGLGHHTLFLLYGCFTLRARACGYFMGGLVVEVPTLLLALGAVHEPWKNDALIGATFFFFRVLHTAWYVWRLAQVGLRAFAGMLALSLCVNAHWLYTWADPRVAKKCKRAAVAVYTQ
jgi:hypothetical protein